MTAPLDPIIASARIVAPEEAALNVLELISMKVMLMAARRDGVEAHIVQFAGGAAAMVCGDPTDTASWHALLAKTHAAATAGHVGPVHLGAEDK